MPSTRTPEGEPNVCSVCGDAVRIEPSVFPVRDAPCPRCGCLIQFDDPKVASARLLEPDREDLVERIGLLSPSPNTKRILVDLGEEKMMTSEVIGKLLRAHLKAMAKGLRLAVCNVHPDVRDVFRITKLDRVLEIIEA